MEFSDSQLMALAAYFNFVWILIVCTVLIIRLREPITIGSKKE